MATPWQFPGKAVARKTMDLGWQQMDLDPGRLAGARQDFLRTLGGGSSRHLSPGWLVGPGGAGLAGGRGRGRLQAHETRLKSSNPAGLGSSSQVFLRRYPQIPFKISFVDHFDPLFSRKPALCVRSFLARPAGLSCPNGGFSGPPQKGRVSAPLGAGIFRGRGAGRVWSLFGGVEQNFGASR